MSVSGLWHEDFMHVWNLNLYGIYLGISFKYLDRIQTYEKLVSKAVDPRNLCRKYDLPVLISKTVCVFWLYIFDILYSCFWPEAVLNELNFPVPSLYLFEM